MFTVWHAGQSVICGTQTFPLNVPNYFYFQLVLWRDVSTRCDGPSDGREGGRSFLGQGLSNDTGEDDDHSDRKNPSDGCHCHDDNDDITILKRLKGAIELMTMVALVLVFWIGEIVAPPGGDVAVRRSSVGAQWEVTSTPPLGMIPHCQKPNWEVITDQR